MGTRDAKPSMNAVKHHLDRFYSAGTTEGTPHPSYLRLAEAATLLQGIRGEAALAGALKSSDQQKINNWQRRGVSKDGALDAERYLGCPATWILDGVSPPCEAWSRLTMSPEKKSAILEERIEVRELTALANKMDPDSVKALILMLRKLHP